MLRGTQLSGFNSGDSAPVRITPDIGAWVDSLSVSLATIDALGYNGQTMRQVIVAPILSTSGNRVKLVLAPSQNIGSSGAFGIDALYIGEQATSGDPYDMKASAPAPAQFLVNGIGSFATSSKQFITTDVLTFAIDKTKNYVIAAHFNAPNSDIGGATSATGATSYFKSAVNEAATANVTGYTSDGTGSLRLITKIQVFVNIDSDAFYAPMIGIVPTNTVLPVISGTTTVGSTLTTTNGTWTQSPTSYSYIWRRNSVNIPGATASTYLLVSADLGTTITVRVTATNAGGSSFAISSGVGPIS